MTVEDFVEVHALEIHLLIFNEKSAYTSKEILENGFLFLYANQSELMRQLVDLGTFESFQKSA